MSLRPLTREDADVALGVWNRGATFDEISRPLLEEKIWQDPDYDPELAWGFEAGAQLVGFAVGTVRGARDPTIGYVKLIVVEPWNQRQGIGSLLLECLETQLAQRGAPEIRIAESAPNYLTPGVDLRYAPARSFFEHHGYELFAQAVNLRVDLTDAVLETEPLEQRFASQGIAIRRARLSDWPAVVTLLDVHWPSWKAETRRSLANSPASLHLALQHETVIGFAAYHGNNLGTGWFGPMGTAPQRRQSGVGSVLLRRCLSDLKSQGFQTSTIAWAAHLDFYERQVAATVDREFGRYRKLLGE